jgi:hypothetical protein
MGRARRQPCHSFADDLGFSTEVLLEIHLEEQPNKEGDSHWESSPNKPPKYQFNMSPPT